MLLRPPPPLSLQIKDLAAKKQKLTAMLQQLQESRDKAAAGLSKLRSSYETMAADNERLRADNKEIRGLIDGLKQKLQLQGVPYLETMA